MECHFWAGTEIDERVKRHTDIVVEFFGGAFAGTLHDEGLRDSGKGELESALKVQAVSPEAGYLNVRPQPSTERPPVAQVADGTVLEALEPGADARAKVGQGGQWLHVRTPTGVTGYVAAWYLRLYKEAEPPPPPSPAPPPAGVRVQVVSPEAGYLNVRPLPSTAQAPIAQVNDGAVLEPLEPEADVQAKVGQYDQWLHIRTPEFVAPAQVVGGGADDSADGDVAAESSADSGDSSVIRRTVTEQVVRVTVDESAITTSAASDLPVRSKDEDKLGFKVYAEALAAFIASEDTTTPLVISIDAPWGHGKTSLMYMIRNELNPKRPWYSRFWLWLKLQGWRARWLIISPIWYSARLTLWVAERLKQDRRSVFVSLAEWMRRPEPSEMEGSGTPGSKEARQKAQVSERLFRWSAKARQPIEARHPTVWFNAWKFDDEEAVWSALAVAILNQIKTNYSWVGRFFFWLRLWVKRFKHLRAWKDVVGKVFWPALLGTVGWFWAQYSGQIDFLPPIGQGLVQWMLWGGAILTAGIQLASIVQDPFSLSFGSYIKAPNYREKIGFIGDFEEDFRHIVEIATSQVWGWKQRKLIIFIDDLDRCEPPKPADVVEAINVFLDSQGCVFVVGMDSRAVVASIETKYETLFKKAQSESPDQPTLGRCFLEKIVQVPFAIPPVTDRSMSALVKQVIGPKPEVMQPVQEVDRQERETVIAQADSSIADEPEESPAGREPRGDVGSYRKNVDVWEAINRGVRYLEANPRQLKRFVNLFRLQLYIAHARGLFRELVGEGEFQSGYTLDSLAAWIALLMRWPRIAFCLRQEYQKAELCQRLLWIAQLINEKGDWIGAANVVTKMDEHRLDLDLAGLLEPKSEITSDTPKRVLLAEFPAQHADEREEEGKDTPSSRGLHWRAFPWDRWLGNRDFLQVVKALEEWWVQPMDEQGDWLTIALVCDEPDLVGQASPTGLAEVSGEVQMSTTEAPA
jgi:hypothetical protein